MKKLRLLKKLQLSRKATSSDRFSKSLFAIGGIGFLGFFAYLAYARFPQVPVEALLPPEETVAYIELSDTKLPDKIQTALSSKGSLSQLTNQWFGIDAVAMMQKFGNGKSAITLLQDEAGKNHPLLFAQPKTKRAALRYFESMLLPGETLNKSRDRHPVYSFPQGQE